MDNIRDLHLEFSYLLNVDLLLGRPAFSSSGIDRKRQSRQGNHLT